MEQSWLQSWRMLPAGLRSNRSSLWVSESHRDAFREGKSGFNDYDNGLKS